MTETLVFESTFDSFADWKAALSGLVPDLAMARTDEVEDPASVRYAMVWKPRPGFFARFANLSWVVNLGAGVDGLLGSGDLPELPISRLSDPHMSRMMAAYVTFAVLRHARDIPHFERAQRAGRWSPIRPRETHAIKVGVLGLGELGGLAAEELARLGFDVRGWSRSKKDIPAVACHWGDEGLEQVLRDSHILVVMLPLTPLTKGLLDHARLSLLPAGAAFINASRGHVVVEEDLIGLLRSGHIAEATLDVFEAEPLPLQSPLWSMENVLITPHIASVPLPGSAAPSIAQNIARLRAGLPPLHQVSADRGY